MILESGLRTISFGLVNDMALHYIPPFPAPRPSLRHSFILGSPVGEYYSIYSRTAAPLPLCEWMPSLPEEMHWIIKCFESPSVSSQPCGLSSRPKRGARRRWCSQGARLEARPRSPPRVRAAQKSTPRLKRRPCTTSTTRVRICCRDITYQVSYRHSIRV